MKNKIAILFYTKSSRALISGLLPIYLRITVDGVRIEASTSKYVEKSRWSVKGGKIKGSSEEARTINSYLDVLKNKVYETGFSPILLSEILNFAQPPLVGKRRKI